MCRVQKPPLLDAGVSKSGKFRLNESSSGEGWILRVSTEGAYIRGANGNVSVHPEYEKSVNLLCKGWGTFGDAGRTGTWDDVILYSEKEEFLPRIKPSRGDAYLLFAENGKEPVKLNYSQADALEIDLAGSSPTSRGSFTVF